MELVCFMQTLNNFKIRINQYFINKTVIHFAFDLFKFNLFKCKLTLKC